MNLKAFNIKDLTIDKQRNVLAISAAILLLSNLCLTVSLSQKQNKPMIVMVPTIDKEMIVGESFVSEDYLLVRAEQIMQLLFGIRHENFSYNVNQILKQVSSNNKAAFSEQLEMFVSDVKSKQYFYVFNKDSYVIDPQNLYVQFSGYLETYVNDRRIATNHKTYRLSFSNRGGLVQISSFEEIQEGTKK